MKTGNSEKILVIRHGALGDIICSLGAFKAIRRHHPNTKITIMTSKGYVDFCMKTGCFDDYYIDNRQPFWHVSRQFSLRSWFRAQSFNRVYDLQTSNRTSLYYKFFGPGPMPEWSGIATGCSHPQTHPERGSLHIYDRLNDQLAVAGIANAPYPDFDWLEVDVSRFNLPVKYIVLIPGCSANADYKRWPYYGQLAKEIIKWGYTPVIIGGPVDQEAVAKVLAECPECINLAGQTSIFEIVGAARKATAIVGNDTGPSHIAAVVRQPTLMLFSGHAPPQRIAPKFPETSYIENNPLAELSVDRVAGAVKDLLK
jgi:ADP-heptose:LPS heptosyltransferase